MNKITMIGLVAIVAPLLGTSAALAAKPDGSGGTPDVIARSNGFPSGEHQNLNIHGKKDNFICDPTPGGHSVFIDEYGPATIQYVTNKKSSVTELTALDPCATDGGTAKVQLPYEADGYYVFGRILAKPNNGKLEPVSSIILYPNNVVMACNDTDWSNPDFQNYTECPTSNDPPLALGLIVGTNLYVAEPEKYVRFASTTTGKGQSIATDITRLFTYTGWVVDATLDTSGPVGIPDGVIDIYDVPVANYDSNDTTPDNRDYNNDGSIDAADVDAWLSAKAALVPPMAWYFDGEWIMNIADLVITEQGLENDGTKLLQVRFYPVDTTTYGPIE